jgi:hypothetical protein
MVCRSERPAQLSGQDRGRSRIRRISSGAAGPPLCTKHVQSAAPLHGTFVRTTLVVRAFDLGRYAKRRVTCMTVPSRFVLIARPLRLNTFSMGTFSARTSAMNS